MLSRQNLCLSTILVCLCLSITLLAQSASDKILKFYWDQARSATASRLPDNAGLSYSLLAHTVYREFGEKGFITHRDSVTTRYFFAFGKLDSAKTIRKSSGTIPNVDLTYPDVFENQYQINLFPNDTGGATIALGFDIDSSQVDWPVGLTLLDRARYFPRWLYLFYPVKEGYRRFSRSLRLVEKDNFIFPDSIWEVATVDRLFSNTAYRLDTGIREITIYRK
jgi:hypothetical protein